MYKFDDIFGENGALTPQGKQNFSMFMKIFQEICFSKDDLLDMSESELRHVGGSLHKLVGDFISEASSFKQEEKDKYKNMSNKDFSEKMKEKYGKYWALKSLEYSELQRALTYSNYNEE